MKNKLLKLVLLLPFILSGCGPVETSKNVYHTIKFDSDGGTNVASIKVKHNGKISTPKEPTKEKWKFSNWSLYNGTFETENFEVVNGEQKIDDRYLNCDSGYYLAKSDMTFKASWEKLGRIKIWCGLRQTVYTNSDLENKANSTAESMNVEVGVETKGNQENLKMQLVSAEEIGKCPELIVITAYECINSSDIENLYSAYEPARYIEEFSDYFMPFSNPENQTFVTTNFDSSIYKYVQNESGIFGFPLFSIDTMLYSKSLVYDIPGKIFGFAFIDKPSFEGREDRAELRALSETFAKQLSQTYAEI